MFEKSKKYTIEKIFISLAIVFFLFVWIAVSFFSGDSNNPLSKSDNIRGAGLNSSQILQGSIIKNEFSELARKSPQAGMVSFESVHRSDGVSIKDEFLVLMTEARAANSVNISGWTLKNTHGKKVSIGSAAYFPKAGYINFESDIILLPGERVIVSSGQSPIGNSFRVNACSGYLEQFQDFIPPLSSSCPKPLLLQEADLLDDTCRRYISSLPNCEFPASLPQGLSGVCVEHINEHLNYNGCSLDYQNVKNFYKEEWRVFLGQEERFLSGTGAVILLDINGLYVDRAIY